MGYNMEGGVDFNKGVHDKMGWKKGGNSGYNNNKQGQGAETYNTDKVVNTEHQSQQEMGIGGQRSDVTSGLIWVGWVLVHASQSNLI